MTEDNRVMTMMNLTIPSSKTVNSKSDVVIEIYKMTCSVTGKSYIGQTVSHVLNHGVYRRYGSKRRMLSHISESMNTNKKKQCTYLNNAIRKYGSDTFYVECLGACSQTNADYCEQAAILRYKTQFPDGYNILHGGRHFTPKESDKVKTSDGVKLFFDNIRKQKFKNMCIPSSVDPDSIMKPIRRNGVQSGWYVRYKNIRTAFEGVHVSLDESRQRAYQFITQLQATNV